MRGVLPKLFCLAALCAGATPKVSLAAESHLLDRRSPAPQALLAPAETAEGDEYYPNGLEATSLQVTRIPFPGTESLANNSTVYDGSDPALCARSSEKGIWLAQYGLAAPLTPGVPLEIDAIEIPTFSLTNPMTDVVVEVKICADYSEVGVGMDPCQGAVHYDTPYPLGSFPAGEYAITLPIIGGPIVLDDFMGGGVDLDHAVTIQFTWKSSGSIAYGDVSMFVWCGPPDVGFTLTPFLFRDQNEDGVVRTTAAAGGANDRRAPVAGGDSKWAIHIIGAPDPLMAEGGMDLLQSSCCSSWTLDPGNLFIFPGALDFGDDGTDCTADSGGLSSDELSGTIPLCGSPLNVDADGDGLADNLLGGPVDTALFRPNSAPLPPGGSRTVPLELWGLSLVSATPVTTTRGGGSAVEQWNLHLCQAEGTQGGGTLTYNRGVCSVADLGGNAGTADFDFIFSPKLALTRVAGGGPCTVSLTNLSTGGITPNISASGSGPYYDGDTSSLGLVEDPEHAPPAEQATYDADCNGLFTEAPAWPTTPNKLGVDHLCCPELFPTVGVVSYSGDGLSVHAFTALLYPDAQIDSDADGVPDGADNCPSISNPCQELVCDPVLGSLCSDFDCVPTTQGWQASVATVAVQSSPPGPSGNYLAVMDSSGGPSVAWNPSLYPRDWQVLAEQCWTLEFDVRIFDDGDTPTVGHQPTIFIAHDPDGPGGAPPIDRAYFRANLTISEATGTFTHVVAPLGPFGASPPVTPAGTWTVTHGSWANLLPQIDYVELPVELTGGTESWGWDNICLVPGACLCGDIANEKVLCSTSPPGSYTVTFDVTNTSGVTAHYLLLPNPETTPHVISLDPPLPSGQTRTVTIGVNGVVPEQGYCFDVALADATAETCCSLQICVDIPRCDCFEVPDSRIQCVDADTITLQLSITNFTNEPVEHVFLFPPVGSGVTITPDYFDVPTLPPLATTTIGPVTISPATAGTTFGLRVSVHNQDLVECCSRELDFPVPGCQGPGGSSASTLLMAESGGACLLSWSPIPGVEAYDVVRGDLGALRGTAGNFSPATTACLANDLGARLTNRPRRSLS